MSAGVAALGAKVRVVKCPKCEKLLPELADFTVYKCGGCNATLQAQVAKKQIEAVEISPEKSDGEKLNVTENSEKFLNMKRVGSESSDGLPEADCEDANLNYRRKEGLVLNKAAGVVSTSVPPGENVIGLKELRENENIRSDRDAVHVLPSNAAAGNININASELETSALSEERNRFLSSCREPRGETWPSREGIKLAPYPDEGSSNSHAKQNIEELKRQFNLDQDQGELLRKLDELRDQLRQSCVATDKMRERTPYKRSMASGPYGNCGNDTWFTDSSLSQNRVSRQHSPSFNGQSLDMPNFYQVMHPQSGIPGYREPFVSQPVGVGASLHPHVQYPQRPCVNYPYGQMNPDHAIHYHHDDLYSKPACSCFHNCNRNWQLSARAPPAIFSGQRAPCIANNHGLYSVENSMLFGRQSFNHSVPSASLCSYAPVTNKRVIVSKEGRSCRPIAGAAPFVLCCSCSKVLELPPKLLLIKKKFKLRCGSCFQVISVEYDGKRLTTTASTQTMHVPSEPGSSSTIEMIESLNFHDPINQYPGGDFDSPIYDVHHTDEKLVLPSFANSSPDMLEKMQGLSFSSSTSEDVGSPNNMDALREHPVNVEVPSHVSGQPLAEHFGYLSSCHVNNGPGVGSKSRRSDQENILSANGNVKPDTVNVPVPYEMDLSVDDYPNPGSSQDSWDLARDEDQTKFSKGGESFFTSVIKKGIKEFRSNPSLENGRCKVTINGRLLSDRLVKKAEKKAGPIHPGDYWYDYRAGFWGVMGHPCIGIIPPFIEEFNYPMPKNCAGGNTGVLVNGRELHQKDLDLLVSRGFPPTEGQSYMVEISGKVWDEATGEELDSLGKLAPTIERVKHGFGMRVLTVTM